MKVIILHGEDTVKSYARLKQFINVAKKRNWEILYDDLQGTASLFGKERLTILRDYKLFKNNKIDGTLVIYHEGNLPAAFLKTLPKDTRIEEFKLPKLIWNFLNKPTIEMFHEIIKTEAPEFIFVMLVWKMKKDKKYDLISKLAEIDYNVKTGKANLISSLDLLIVKEL
ncbi:MAG TPA: hypothetical protein VL401_02350, partial [Alphaproteobacteria bacterium]|nr:hypothetical protein [Alphaproteobacteria bacterium]